MILSCVDSATLFLVVCRSPRKMAWQVLWDDEVASVPRSSRRSFIGMFFVDDEIPLINETVISARLPYDRVNITGTEPFTLLSNDVVRGSACTVCRQVQSRVHKNRANCLRRLKASAILRANENGSDSNAESSPHRWGSLRKAAPGRSFVSFQKMRLVFSRFHHFFGGAAYPSSTILLPSREHSYRVDTCLKFK